MGVFFFGGCNALPAVLVQQGLSQGFEVLYFFVFSGRILLTGHFLFFRSKLLQPPFLLFSGGISSAPFFGPARVVRSCNLPPTYLPFFAFQEGLCTAPCFTFFRRHFFSPLFVGLGGPKWYLILICGFGTPMRSFWHPC